MTTVTRQMADWVAQPGTLPRRVLEEAKNQILGMLAAVHAGHFSDAGRVVARAAREWNGGKEATLVPSGERTAVHYAVTINAALALALDYDDYMFGARTGPAAVLTTLAMAEKVGSSGLEFLTAQVLANEIGGRLGLATCLAVGDAPLAGFVNQAAGAVAGSVLLKLDGAQTEHALGLALAQGSAIPSAAVFGSEAKVVTAALAAPVGLQAAELAASGLRGAYDAIGGEGGLLQRVGQPILPGACGGLGNVWLTESLGYKLYPGSPYLAAAIDCVLGLVRQHHLDPRKVQAVHVAAGPHTLAMDARSAPFVHGADTLPSTLTQSAAYCIAAALVERELSPRQFIRERIANAAVWDLAGKVRLSLDDELARRARDRSPLRIVGDDGASAQLFDIGACDINAYKSTFPARVRIELDGGRSFDAEQDAPLGSGARPFDDRRKVVEDKFRRETRFILRKERMEKAIDLVHHLDDAGAAQVRELARLVCSEKN